MLPSVLGEMGKEGQAVVCVILQQMFLCPGMPKSRSGTFDKEKSPWVVPIWFSSTGY